MSATLADGTTEVFYEKSVTLAENGAWSRDRVRIPKHLAYQPAKLCVESTAPEVQSREGLRPGMVVGAPKIMSGFRSRAKDLPSVRDKSTQKAEAELQQRQLEALGYIE
jgi:uncharacterized membrane-anchored protein